MMVILVIIGYVILLIYEFVPLYKEQKWVDFWVNAFLCSISFTIAVLLSLNFKIPSPETPIRQVITALFGK
jgi:4-hydroxybenzoate polyprenyltransferase